MQRCHRTATQRPVRIRVTENGGLDADNTLKSDSKEAEYRRNNGGLRRIQGMSDWNRRKERELFIPGKDTPKTCVCNVCGSKIVLLKKNRYTAMGRNVTGGLSSVINGSSVDPDLYDAYDCNVCGCQFIAQKRLEVYRENFER